MSNENIIQSKGECDLVIEPNGNNLRIECHPNTMLVIDAAGYIKLQLHSGTKNRTAFRIKIIAETFLEYKANRYDMERQTERIGDND